MKTSEFDYELPEELIAQEPPEGRGDSRMMVLDRTTKSIRHSWIRDLPDYLRRGDLLVFNNTKVFPARTRGVRADTGGRVELVFVRQTRAEVLVWPAFESEWLCIFGSGSKTRAGQRLLLCGERIKAELTEVGEHGHVTVKVKTNEPLMQVLEKAGEIPLPPYIERGPKDSRNEADRERYQTVFASQAGAVAAPTAGLHFTEELLQAIRKAGADTCEITLHVGPGTFIPVKADDVQDHKMHSEFYSIGKDVAEAVGRTRKSGGRVIAVGTTTTRALEGAWVKWGGIQECSGETDIFIYPPYRFNVVDAMITNFHLPRSTLLMMLSAFAGREFMLEAYQCAVAESYRFYSYGDCMLIEDHRL